MKTNVTWIIGIHQIDYLWGKSQANVCLRGAWKLGTFNFLTFYSTITTWKRPRKCHGKVIEFHSWISVWTMFILATQFGLIYSIGCPRNQSLQWYTCILTLCGLVTSYGNIDLGQHRCMWSLVAWRHQAITWANADCSLVRLLCGIHLRAISQCPSCCYTKWVWKLYF